jgi:hypothetical protein
VIALAVFAVLLLAWAGMLLLAARFSAANARLEAPEVAEEREQAAPAPQIPDADRLIGRMGYRAGDF